MPDKRKRNERHGVEKKQRLLEEMTSLTARQTLAPQEFVVMPAQFRHPGARLGGFGAVGSLGVVIVRDKDRADAIRITDGDRRDGIIKFDLDNDDRIIFQDSDPTDAPALT